MQPAAYVDALLFCQTVTAMHDIEYTPSYVNILHDGRAI